jgi:hypothetical protein
MVPWYEYLRSVEGIAAVWLASAVVVSVITARALRGLNWGRLRELARCESGAAYSLAYVLTFPLYLWMVCLLIESSMLLVTKLGTVYAAYAAARSAVVWRSTQIAPVSSLQTLPSPAVFLQPKRAAVHAMTPFASSWRGHADGPSGGGLFSTADDFAREAGKRVQGEGVSGYLKDKYRYASKATSVLVFKSGNKPDGMLTVRVRYQAPTWTGLGRFFGAPSPWRGNYYVVELSTEIHLPDEAPKSMNGDREGKMGINYYVLP